MIYGLIIILVVGGVIALNVGFRILEERQRREEREAVYKQHYEQEILKVLKDGTGLRRKDWTHDRNQIK